MSSTEKQRKLLKVPNLHLNKQQEMPTKQEMQHVMLSNLLLRQKRQLISMRERQKNKRALLKNLKMKLKERSN